MTDTRVHRLAQAAQVGDLLADRAAQLLEHHQALELELLALGADTSSLERLGQLRANLLRSVAAYNELRRP